ncbi:hypothetical protein HDU81_000134 [Chytriomyces hyalinus]|nr:hypothetical protein HDU81_000134 [Chytriomyces hyalinus]
MSPGIGSQVLRWRDSSKRTGKRNVSSAPVMSGRRSDTPDTQPAAVADTPSPILMGSVLALVHISTQSAFRALLVRVHSVSDIDRAALAILSASENFGQNTVPAPPSQPSTRPNNTTLFRSGSLYSKRKPDLRDQIRPRSGLTLAAANRIKAAALGHLSFAAIAGDASIAEEDGVNGHAVVVFVPILDGRQRDADESLEESTLHDPWYLHLDQVSRIFDETEINSPCQLSFLTTTRDEYKFQCTSSSIYSRWIDVLDECFDECHPYESLNQHYLMQGKRASYISSSHATYNNIPSSPTIYLTDRSKSGESSGSGGGGVVWTSRSDNAKKASSLTDDVNSYWSSGGRGTSDASSGARRGREQETFSLRRASTKSPLSSATFSQVDSILETERVKSITSSEWGRGRSSSSITHRDMEKSVVDSVETLQSTSVKSEKPEDSPLFIEHEHSPASSKSTVKTKQTSATTSETTGTSGLTRMASFMQPNISIVRTNDKPPNVDIQPSVDDKALIPPIPQISKPHLDSSALTTPTTTTPEPTPRAAEVFISVPRVRRVEKRLSNSSLVSTLATSGEVKSMFFNAGGISIGSLSPVIELTGKPEHASSAVRVESKSITEGGEVTVNQHQETRKAEKIESKDEAGQTPIAVTVSKSVQFTLPEQSGVRNATQSQSVQSDEANVAVLNNSQKQNGSGSVDRAQTYELRMSPTSSERTSESVIKSPNRLVSASLRNSRRSSFVSSLRETTERILRETGVAVPTDTRCVETVKTDIASVSPKSILLNQLKIAMDSANAVSLVIQQGDGKSIVHKNGVDGSFEKSQVMAQGLSTTEQLGAIADQHKPDSIELHKESENAVIDKHEEQRIEEQAFIKAFETSSRSVSTSSPQAAVPATSEIRLPMVKDDERPIKSVVGYTPWNSPISPKIAFNGGDAGTCEQPYLGDIRNVAAYSYSKPASPIPSDELFDSICNTSMPPEETSSSEPVVTLEQSMHGNDTDSSDTLQSQENHPAVVAYAGVKLDELRNPQNAADITVERTPSVPWITDACKALDSPIQDLLDELAKEEWTDVYDDVLMLPDAATQDLVSASKSFLMLDNDLQISPESFVTLKDELMAAERISALEPDSPLEPVVIPKHVFSVRSSSLPK